MGPERLRERERKREGDIFANSKNHIERNKAASRKIMRDTVKLCGINAAPNGKLRTTSQMAMGESGTGTGTGCRDLGSFGLFFIVRQFELNGGICPQFTSVRLIMKRGENNPTGTINNFNLMQTIPFSTECKAGSILNQYRILTYSHSHSHSHSLSYANDMVKQNEGFQKDI